MYLIDREPEEDEDDDALDQCDDECPWCGFPRFDCKCDDDVLDAATDADRALDEEREDAE